MMPDLKELIEALGSTREQIVASLTACGITGEVDQANLCPIANYLRWEEWESPEVCLAYVVARRGEMTSSLDVSTLTNRAAVRSFIALFDKREIPQLITPKESADGSAV